MAREIDGVSNVGGLVGARGALAYVSRLLWRQSDPVMACEAVAQEQG
jgi:hypothetical protein